MSIPFNKPVPVGTELEYIKDAIGRGQLAGDGYYTKASEQIINQVVGSHSTHLTHSCTAALEMAAILAELEPGDEVIMPSYTFVSTANAVVLRGAVPVFVDVDGETFNIDPDKIESAIGPKTKAIFVVHYAGVVCEMERINRIAFQNNLLVVEDAAQALGSSRKGRHAGNFGNMAAFSFHETKNIISGEGGCLTTPSKEYQYRAEIIREKGTNRRAFFRGMVDKYSWVDVGSSYLPGELVAAFLFGQLEQLSEINRSRMEAWELYHENFKNLENAKKLRRPIIPSECLHNAHMYYILLPDSKTRDSFISHMKDNGIYTPFHYVPLHSSEFGKKCARHVGNMENTMIAANNLVRLPLFPGISDEINRVISVVNLFFD